MSADVRPSSQHSADASAATRVVALVFRDVGGRLVLDDSQGGEGIPLVDDGTGRLRLDDNASGGVRFVATHTRILTRS